MTQLMPAYGEPITNRIIAGTVTAADTYPTVASIDADGSVCTGTLISTRHVLTAGHCVHNQHGKVVDSRKVVSTFAGKIQRGTRQIFVHPLYTPTGEACRNGSPDAAVLELDTPISGVVPNIISRSLPLPGTRLLLVGYGMLGDGARGQNGAFPDNGKVAFGYTTAERVSSTFISWKFRRERNDSNTAGGDSGGPSFQEIGDTLMLSGITCGGTGNAEWETESYNTRTDILVPWLKTIIPQLPEHNVPPSLKLPRSLQARVGQNFSYSFSLIGGSVDSVTVEGLPEGLALRNGSIRGVPQNEGRFVLTFRAENAFGSTQRTKILIVRKSALKFRIQEVLLSAADPSRKGFTLSVRGHIKTMRVFSVRFPQKLSLNIGGSEHRFVIGKAGGITEWRGRNTIRASIIRSHTGTSHITFQLKLFSYDLVGLIGDSSPSLSDSGEELSPLLIPITLRFAGTRATVIQAVALDSLD
jgi:hypothetical protein